jgi:hypothetical protein
MHKNPNLVALIYYQNTPVSDIIALQMLRLFNCAIRVA